MWKVFGLTGSEKSLKENKNQEAKILDQENRDGIVEQIKDLPVKVTIP